MVSQPMINYCTNTTECHHYCLVILMGLKMLSLMNHCVVIFVRVMMSNNDNYNVIFMIMMLIISV